MVSSRESAAREQVDSPGHPAHPPPSESTRFESIVRTLPHGVCEIDLAGRVRYLNIAGERLLGRTATELIGLPLHDAVHTCRAEDEDQHGANDCPLLQFVDGTSLTDARDTFVRPDGTAVLVDVDGTQVQSSGWVTGAVITFHDVTERLRQEQLKDDFLAFASHELRSPLTVVSALAQFLERHLATHPSGFDEPSREAVDGLGRETDRMVALVEVFLDLARIESGRLAVELDQVDLASIVQDEAQAARLRAPHMHVTVSADAPFPAWTDEQRIRQVLRTLLDNAATYGGAQPQLSLHLVSENGLARIDVSDDGPGVAVDDQPHIFSRLYRGHSEAGHKGLGVGLFIASEVVRRLGGTISLESIPGNGATFTVRLPVDLTA